MSAKLKLVTFNAGLLLWKLLGISIFEPVPYTMQRLQKLPEVLCKTQTDIIALQEVYSNKDKEFIINQMKKDYPYSA
ncbi:hypothetical protein GOV06_05540, partial [Candidatus Woesearchaeota archaeon]|nr:hypothetical protein [Candidatus Woesearchaeota archaeon]